MKQLRLFLITLLISLVAVLGACSNTTNENASKEKAETKVEQTEQKEEVVITISKDDGKEEIAKKVLPIKKDDILMDVMEKNFTLETDEEGSFIIGIDGVKAKDGEQKGWIYFVNDEMAMVGAQDYTLSPGDHVQFDFQKWK